jgi:D-alanyl-D-alanine dipeptidase
MLLKYSKCSFFIIIITICFNSCKKETKNNNNSRTTEILAKSEVPNTIKPIDYDTLVWSEIIDSENIILDLKYATHDNFTNASIYDCGRCFLNKSTALKLREMSSLIYQRYGLRFKIFDCYRPLTVQRALWNQYPNPNYVTNPDKGSMHNRGMAVDLTVVDKEGKEWDMGTPFDFFGRKSHIDYMDLPSQVIKNRKALILMMEKAGFKGIRTEWWHFSDRENLSELSEWEWECKN